MQVVESNESKVYTGDCLELLKKLAPDSISSLITDPPAAISFMNKEWDADKGGKKEWCEWFATVMKECFRVMKPGSHAFVWSLPKRSHWVANALEDAGFEIKDIVHHLQGNGFPTGCDISKEIDKKFGAERKVLGKDMRLDDRYDVMLTEPATPEAKQWDGWKTRLKPATEHWILCQKPIGEKTITDNVLKWASGGLHIKSCEAPGGRFPTNAVLTDVDFGKQTEYFPQVEPWLYCAKPHSGERNKGLEDMPKHEIGHGDKGEETKSNTNKGPRNQLRKDKPTVSANFHPTIKPVKLMSWLCDLITEPGGLILDPFAGSGTTGIAAVQGGYKFIGFELNPAYTEIANKRIAANTPT